MATPTIEAISTQDITIDTDYALEIGITNDPEEVTVGGLLEGFYYSWDADNDTLTIAGEATRLLGDAIWVVSAKETPTSAAVTREITYNVVSSAPIIEEVGEQSVFQGAETDIFVEIQNRPTQISVGGLLTGLKFEPDSEGSGADAVEGVRFQGTLPLDANLTVDNTDFDIVASSDGGEDSYSVPITIVPGFNLYLFNETDDELFKIRPTGTLSWTYSISNRTATGFNVYLADDGIYLFYSVGNSTTELIKISASGSTLWTYAAPNGTYVRPITITDGAVYLFDTSVNHLLKVDSSDGLLLWTYEATSGGNFGASAPVVADDGIYIFDDLVEDLLKVSPSGSLLWAYEAAGSQTDYGQLVVVSDGVYLFHVSTETLVKISPSGSLLWENTSTSDEFPVFTDDGIYAFDEGGDILKSLNTSDGSSLWSYSAPNGTYDPIIVAHDGIYLFNDATDTLRKVNLTGSLDWTYTAPSGTYQLIVVADHGIYLFNETADDLLKVDPDDGLLLWTYEAPSSIYNTPVVAPDGIYLPDRLHDQNDNAERHILKVSLDGSLLWTYDLPTGEHIYDRLVAGSI